MFDWNNDGKQDWYDDYTINEIIPEKKHTCDSDGNYQHSCNTKCTLAIVIGIAILWEIVNLLALLCHWRHQP